MEGRLTLSWTPFAGGTRRAKAAAIEDQMRSLHTDYLETRRRVKLEVRDAVAHLATARQSVDVESKGIHQARESLRVETARYKQGRVTTNDLLLAESQLRQRLSGYHLSQLAVVEAWVQLWLAVGDETLWFLEY